MNRKLIGISRRMRNALEKEGLILARNAQKFGIIYEGMFCTKRNLERTVDIDLRYKFIDSEKEADIRAAQELNKAYKNFDQEEGKELKRFAIVADCVARDEPIPPKPEEAIWKDSCSDSFYVIQSANATNLYWRTLDGYHNGAVDECWGDVRTADRYDSSKEAEVSIKKKQKELGYWGKPPGTVRRVEVKQEISLYEV